MRRGEANRWVALFVTALAATSCASLHAPRGVLPTARDAPQDAAGAWIEIEPSRASGGGRVTGEFLAVGVAGDRAAPESVYVLTGAGFDAIPLTAIHGARIEVYESEAGRGRGMVLGGMFLSLSNGLGFIITGPLWLLVGSIATGEISHEPIRSTDGSGWEPVRAYARFPAGLPPGLDRAAVVAAPRVRPMPTYRITLKRGGRMDARSIFASRSGILDVRLVNGKTEHLEWNDIATIVNERGVDVTKSFEEEMR